MIRHLAKLALLLGLCGLLAATGGCASTESLTTPKFSSVKRITKRILTGKEKDKTIEDMSVEQKTHREEAEREIEKR